MSEDAKTKPLMTKEALLNSIQTAFELLQRMVNELDDEAMTEPIGEGDWTWKDTLAHIAGWEEILVRFHIGGEPFAAVIEMDGAQYRITSYDDVNEHLYKRYLQISPTEAKALLLRTHEEVLVAINSFPEEQLHQHHPELSTGEAASINWIDYIAANTYEHYEEHGTP